MGAQKLPTAGDVADQLYEIAHNSGESKISVTNADLKEVGNRKRLTTAFRQSVLDNLKGNLIVEDRKKEMILVSKVDEPASFPEAKKLSDEAKVSGVRTSPQSWDTFVINLNKNKA